MERSSGIPVIDMKEVDGLSEKIVRACEEWGCFRLINHGVLTDLMAQMKAVARSLFELPVEIKHQISNPRFEGSHYVPVTDNNVGPVFESMAISDVVAPEAVDDFLHQLSASPHQRTTLTKYSKALYDLAQGLTRKLVEGMGLEGEFFEGRLCQLRLNKYNFSPQTTLGSVGAVLHSDPGFFTIVQDDEIVGGLEVFDPNLKELIPAEPLKDSLMINVGDVGKVWSNGRFCNVKHRVQCYGAETRISIAFFTLGPKDAKVEVAPQLVGSIHPRVYVPFSYEEYRRVRTNSTSFTGEALKLFQVTKS